MDAATDTLVEPDLSIFTNNAAECVNVPSIYSAPSTDCDESVASESTFSTLLHEDDPVHILCEVVCASKLSCDELDEHERNMMQPYATVEFRREIIHKTAKSYDCGRNPVWTISNQSLFVLKATPRKLVHNDLVVSLWSKRKDPLKLTTLANCALGQARVSCTTILDNCNEERVTVNLTAEDGIEDQSVTGSVTLRFRLATHADETFVTSINRQTKRFNLLEQRQIPSIQSKTSFDKYAEMSNTCVKPKRPVATIVSEVDSAIVAGESLVQAFSSAFTARYKYDRVRKERKVLVKPHCDPNHPAETTYMTPVALKAAVYGPSYEYVEAGSGTLGKVYLEILACQGLPNVDIGEAVGNVTDAFICAVFEDAMVQTPVVNDELSPLFPPWTQRAFVFGVMHPASILYLGVFDSDFVLKGHEPLGRVAVNMSNLQRDTDYTLQYNLYTSANVTDRTASGKITIRLRVSFNDEKEAVLAALKPRPRFHVNVKKERSLRLLHFTCYGEFGNEEEQKFDLTVTRSRVNEILEYKNALMYCIGDVFWSLLLWKGQVRICKVLMPLHSFLFFTMCANVVENPSLVPPFTLLSIAWIMLAMQTQRRQHPSPWYRCPTFWDYVHVLLHGQSTMSMRRIEVNEGAKEAEAYEKTWSDRVEHDLMVAEAKAALQEKISTIGNERIESKLPGGPQIPIDLLERLARYQGIIGRYCRYFRFIKIILTWEESIVSFWITACFLVAGLVSLVLPWGFILRWTGRIVVWGLLGPHMKLVDMFLCQNGADEETSIKEAVENFKKESLIARVRYQEAAKLKDIKCMTYGKFITLIPNFNLSRHYDRPLSTSFARVHKKGGSDNIKIAERYIPGQQFFGVMVPRPYEDLLQHNEELPILQELLKAVSEQVQQIQESENVALLKRLNRFSTRIEEEEMPQAIGFELLSFEDESNDKYAVATRERPYAMTMTSLGNYPSIDTFSGLRQRRSSSRRQSSCNMSVVDQHSFNNATSSVKLDSGCRIAVIETEEKRISRRRSLLRQSLVPTMSTYNNSMSKHIMDGNNMNNTINVVSRSTDDPCVEIMWEEMEPRRPKKTTFESRNEVNNNENSNNVIIEDSFDRDDILMPVNALSQQRDTASPRSMYVLLRQPTLVDQQDHIVML